MKNAGTLSLGKLMKTFICGIPPKLVRYLTLQLLTAIDNMHKLNVCHRDLKPDNILLRSDDTEPSGYYLTVVDFNVSVDLTKTPTIDGATGKKKWSAPETRTGVSYNERCDIYSAGCLVLYMLTGTKPDDPSAMEKL